VLPGGHIEKKEDIFTAIKREIMEELNIKVKFIGEKK
jgi:8-oxo-dGTP pyrophosphatase MutT (NUDIX family)